MKNKELVKIEVQKTKSITCDNCQGIFMNDDVDELSEFLYIDITCGYNSIFGDMNRVQADLCQYCVKDKLGSILRITNEQY